MNPLKENFKQYSIMLVWLSLERLYHELGLESLSDIRWSLKLFVFHNIVNGFPPSYLQEILSCHNEPYQTRSKLVNNIEQLRARTNTFESSYFPHCTKEWIKLSEVTPSIKPAKKYKKVIKRKFCLRNT